MILAVLHDLETDEFLPDDLVRELELVVVGEVDGEFVIAFLIERSEGTLDDRMEVGDVQGRCRSCGRARAAEHKPAFFFLN